MIIDHVQNLLALRNGDDPDAQARGEEKFRAQVMRLLGARHLSNLPPYKPKDRRRVEGRLQVTERDGTILDGLVMFALGHEGRGGVADVVSKHAQPSAKSLLAGNMGQFILVVTTGIPDQRLLDLAEEKSELIHIGGVLRPAIWVIGLPEIVARGEAYIGKVEDSLDGKPSWFDRLRGRMPVPPPSSPLLLEMREPYGSDSYSTAG